MRQKTLQLVRGGMIAALYVVLTWVSAVLGLSSGMFQLRFSEVLCILPCFFFEAVPGLTVGCFLANLLTGCALWDVILGSAATLLGALGTRLLRRYRLLAPLPPIFFNVLIIPPILMYVYRAEEAWWLLALAVGAGEVLSCGVLGQLLYGFLSRHGRYIGITEPME